MTVEPLRYAVVCDCGGAAEPSEIAHIDDQRPTEHPLSALRGAIKVTSPSSQKLLTGGIPSTRAVPQDQAVAALAEKNLTETFWGDGHRTVTLRCLRCGKQAQMSYPTLVRVADLLAAAGDRFPLEPAGPDKKACRTIPLGVLCSMLSQLNG